MEQPAVINPENTIASFIVDLVPYMEALGYSVSQDTAALLFRTFKSLDPCSFETLMDMAPVVETFVANTPKQHTSFHNDYMNYIKDKHRIVVNDKAADEIRKIQKESDRCDILKTMLSQKMKSSERRVKTLEKRIQEEENGGKTNKEAAQYLKKYKKVKKEYESIFKNSKSSHILLNMEKIISKELNPAPAKIEAAKQELKKGVKKVIGKKNIKELLSLIETQTSILNNFQKSVESSAKDDLEKEAKNLEELRMKMENVQEEAEEITRNIHERIKEIQKGYGSKNHREEFSTKGNAVHSDFARELFIDKKFKSLTAKEKEDIREYIAANAKKFKTIMSRNIRTGIRRKIDVASTCKNACKTFGIPVNLEYIKPHRQKSRLVLFLDISGSCANASEMMLTFMHKMKEVFSGGCRTYVFTNRLYDVSRIFEESDDTQTFINEVLRSIPRAGAYSDYNMPLMDFYNNHMSELTKDSLLLFIGDARNNKNPTGEFYMKAMCRRAKSAYWLNTEQERMWDQGDSIMSVYSQYMTQTMQITTTGELLGFLETMR